MRRALKDRLQRIPPPLVYRDEEDSPRPPQSPSLRTTVFSSTSTSTPKPEEPKTIFITKTVADSPSPRSTTFSLSARTTSPSPSTPTKNPIATAVSSSSNNGILSVSQVIGGAGAATSQSIQTSIGISSVLGASLSSASAVAMITSMQAAQQASMAPSAELNGSAGAFSRSSIIVIVVLSTIGT